MTDDRVREIARIIARHVDEERFAAAPAFINAARAISSLLAPVGVPEGWKLVPVEPTNTMVDGAPGGRTTAREIYRGMLSVSPQPPQSDEIETLRARVKEMRDLLADSEELRGKVIDVAEQWRARAESAERKLSELTQR